MIHEATRVCLFAVDVFGFSEVFFSVLSEAVFIRFFFTLSD